MSCFPCEAASSDEEHVYIDVSAVLGNPPTIKILLLGEDKVGKSSLIQRLIHNTFSVKYSRNSRTFYEKEVIVDNKCVLLNIYDSIAQDFISMQHPMIKEADVFLLIYSIDSKASFDEIEMIRKRLLRHREHIDNGAMPLVIIGNKCDLEQSRQIHREQGASYCKMLNVPFFETSAAKQINHEQCFYECFRQWMVVKSDLLREKELDRRRREMKLNKKSKAERCGMMIQCKKRRNQQQIQDDEGKYMVRNRKKIDAKLIKKLEDVSMDINMAIVGTHNVGKHSMIHSFIDEVGLKEKEKKDTYYTSIKTLEDIANTTNSLGYKERLELILNVYCIEYRAKDNKKRAKYNKCILTPSSYKAAISRRASIASEEDDVKYSKYDKSHYDDLMCDGFDFNEWHDKQLNITDIAHKNDAFLFVVSMDDKQSFVQCIDIIKSIQNDEHYNYTKPILIVVTKWDLPRSEHKLTECDIAEFAVDIGCPYVLIARDTFSEPFHRVISLIRGYSTPSTWTKVGDLSQHEGSVCCMTQSLDGKYLFSGGNDGTIRVFDIETSICIAILCYHRDKIYCIEEHCITLARQWWKPCRYLITCSGDSTCCVWMIFNNESSFYGVVDANHVVNNENAQPLFINCPRFIFKHDARIKSFVICNNNILCTVGDDKRMKLWSLIDGKLLYDSGDKDMDILNCVVFVKECNKIYAAARNQSVYVWDISRALSCGTRGRKLSGGHRDSVNHLRVCCKNNGAEVYVLSMDKSGYIRCRDARSPHKIYWDYVRHAGGIESASICAINNGNFDCMLCTASSDKTVRGYSVPDGEILFNVKESAQDKVCALDCNQMYIVCAGNDEYVRCYKLMSAEIKYALNRGDIENNLSITLSWAAQRHSSHINRVLCGKKQFKHMVFSCDEDGIILGWDMNNGECCACFGNEESRHLMIINPSRSAMIQFATLFITQFVQLMSLTFCIDTIQWGDFNSTYNPFALCSNLSLTSFVAKYNEQIAVPLEWCLSILCVSIFLFLFFISYRFEYKIIRRRERFYNLLQFVCWMATSVGFIPILRNIFSVFGCRHHLRLYLANGEADCWSNSGRFWIYIFVSSAAAILYLPSAYRMEYRSCDLQQINWYYWFQWSKDYPQLNRVHGASQRNNLFALIEKTIVILMCAISATHHHFASKYTTVLLLIAASLGLCGSVLLFPRFYAHKTNMFHASLLFGVLWTNIWSLFVINSTTMSSLTGWRRDEIDNFQTVVHLTLLLPFMMFGALLMFIRTHKHFYDEIRGDFRTNLYEKRIGFISEKLVDEAHNLQQDAQSAAVYGMRDNLFFIYNKQKKMEHVKQSEDENGAQQIEEIIAAKDRFPPPLRLSAAMRHRVDTQSIRSNKDVAAENAAAVLPRKRSTKTSFSLIPLCENDDDGDGEEEKEEKKEEEEEEEEEEEILLSEISTVIQHGGTEHESSASTTNHAHIPMMDSRHSVHRVIDCDNLHLQKEEEEEVAVKKERKRIYGLLLKSPSNQQKSRHDSSHFDYYARVRDVDDPCAPPPIPMPSLPFPQISSNRSDVTAFSGIGDVPQNIGHHLFDQYP